MKKIAAAIMSIILLLILIVPVWASETTEEPEWYELTRDEQGADILTVRLQSNPYTGYNWSFEISDPEMLELLAQEYVSDKPEAIMMCGVGGMWVASFRNFTGKAGAVSLELEYARAWEDTCLIVHKLDMQISENGEIIVLSEDEYCGTAAEPQNNTQ